MKVLVTGANGMIGTAVVTADAAGRAESLRTQVGSLRAGYATTDDRSSESPSVVCDIADLDALRPVVDGVDVVIHLAGPPSVAASFADPAEFIRAHVIGTSTILQLCRECHVPRLVYVSSAEVYGRPRRNPVEESDPMAPRSPYAAAKVGAESVIGAATRATGLDAVVLRPFSVYGPGAWRDSVLGLILEQTLAGDRIRLRKLDGVRDYCYVGDLADAVWRAATVPLDGLSTFNIASGQGTRVDDLARATLEAHHGRLPEGASVEALFPGTDEPPPADDERPAAVDIAELVADVSRARDELGWQPTTALTDGLARTLTWYAEAMAGR